MSTTQEIPEIAQSSTSPMGFDLPQTLEDANVIIRELMLRQHELETRNQELLKQPGSAGHESEECLQLQKNAHLFMSAIDQSSEAILFTDAMGHILYVNSSFEKISGYSREELLGHTPRIFKSGIHPRDFYKKMWATLLRGESCHSYIINRHKDGSLYEVKDNIAPVRDASGTITNFISVKTSISPLLEAQRTLELSNARLYRSYADLKHSAQEVSHDLQESLNTATCSLQLLKNHFADKLDERADEFISAAMASNHRMRNTIEELLVLSKADAAGTNMVTTETSNVPQ